MRKLLAAYAGNGIQLQRSSDSTTLDIGFNGCDPASTVFCGTQTLAVGTTSSTRVAFPSGTVIHIFNEGPSGIFYVSGNGSVTATTSGTALAAGNGANITVGANTNIAAIIGTGYGLNGTTGSATLFLTNCGASKVYDQSGNSNDLAQTTLANQLGYLPAGSTYNAQPLLFGCLVGCNLHAADSSSYKTTTINAFAVATFGTDITTSNYGYPIIGYPTTTNSSLDNFRWCITNTSSAGVMVACANGTANANQGQDFGGVWRIQNLTQYDMGMSNSAATLRWNGGTNFPLNGSNDPVTITYPNAVGLYVMGDSAGNGSPGVFAEALVASGTQTSRNSISANQVSYWNITAGVAASVALSNPLSDGWNFNAQQIGGFAANPPGPGALTINGNAYATESSWNNYTSWQATNGSTASGQLGDLFRFQITGLFDVWDGTNRSEVDGAGGAADINNGTAYWVAYAVLIEAGTPYTSQWNINGQMHAEGSANVCCVFNVMSNQNGSSDNWNIYTYNTNSAATTTSLTNIASITRGTWYHFVFNVLVSTSGTGDTFKAWCDCVTPGTMAQVSNQTSATLFGGNAVSTISYWKYGIYRQTGVPLPTFAVRFGNVQVCATGSDCTSKYGVSDLSALATTPLANPAHQ